MRISTSDRTYTLLIAAALLLLVLAIAGCPAADEDAASQVPQTTSSSSDAAADVVKQTADKLPAVELTHAVLSVSGMTCGSCEEAIKREVGKLNGVASVAATYADGRVEVAYDAALVGKDAIIAEIEKMQYVVEQFVEGAEAQAASDATPADDGAEGTDDAETEAAEPADDDTASAGAVGTIAAKAVKDGAATSEDCEECDGECDGDCDGGGEGCGGSETAEASDDGGGGCAGCAKEAAGVGAPADVPDGMQRITLKVENMTCAGKSGWVNKTVGELEGVAGCYADEGTLTAVIDFDPAQWDAAKLIEVIQRGSEGFFTATQI